MSSESASTLALSIVIITLNEEHTISRILSQLEKQTFQDYEIIVSDSKSTDRTESIVQEHMRHNTKIHFVQCGVTKGPGYGRNRGEQEANAPLLLFLDADTQFTDSGFLSRAMEKREKKGYATSGVYMKSTNQAWHYRLGVSIINNIFFWVQHSRQPIVAGACMFTKKSMFNKLHGFDTTITLGEDSDYARRTRESGEHFGLLSEYIFFDTRRLEQHGIWKTILSYLRTRKKMLMQKQMETDPGVYPFGHYKDTYK